MKKKASVLVVDDNETNIDILMGILGDEYEVSVALDGERALEVAGEQPPDIVLLDVMMPGMDGYDVCRRLQEKESTRKIPVIFVTSRGEVEDEAMGFEAGGVDYITKPVSPSIVRARVRTHLNLKRYSQELEHQNEVLRENARLQEEIEQINRHDLKNPLSAMISIPRMIIERNGVTERQKDLLLLIEEAGYRMLDLINRSLDIIKMERGIYHIDPVPVNMVEVFEKILREIKPITDGKHIPVTLFLRDKPVSGGESFRITGEEFLFYSLFVNLLKNAVEASPDGRPVKVFFEGVKRPVVRVTNDGAIAEEIRGRFFDKFCTYGKKGGTGLGTYIARLITETLSGKIGFETSEETGTTLTVTFPPSL
ncbi:MAG: hybrid sensor histidine kinase/response regulator [Spirochaetes bacterium]|nr:hybrid sensor histidine kinase/response regulator [Spirochaetota bacterium]